MADTEDQGAASAKDVPERKGRGRRGAKPAAAKAAKAAKEPRPEAAALRPGHVHVYDLEGRPVRTVELPPVFRSDLRFDLIRRAVTAFQANRRQPYGPSPASGMRHSVRWSGKGHGVSRVPRIRGTMIGAQAPGTVGGRRAHPPRPDRIWAKKVNTQERRLARNAALAALKEPEIVARRGHRLEEGRSLPVVVEDGLEALEPKGGAAREGAEVLRKLGVHADVERAKAGRRVRAGRGKMRGRRYRSPTGVLVVVKEPRRLRRFLGNLAGVEVVSPANLNAEILAPGGDPGRLVVFSEGALEVLRSWTP